VTEPNLLVICATAFVAVILLLALLAGVIRVLTRLFPESAEMAPPTEATPDGPLVAAISAATAAAFPGHRVTRIEDFP
jgi:hypothetical protein